MGSGDPITGRPMQSEFEKQRDLAAKEYTQNIERDYPVHSEGQWAGDGFRDGANWSRRYMLESDPVVKGLVEALKFARYKLNHNDSLVLEKALAAFEKAKTEGAGK